MLPLALVPANNPRGTGRYLLYLRPLHTSYLAPARWLYSTVTHPHPTLFSSSSRPLLSLVSGSHLSRPLPANRWRPIRPTQLIKGVMRSLASEAKGWNCKFDSHSNHCDASLLRPSGGGRTPYKLYDSVLDPPRQQGSRLLRAPLGQPIP